MSEERFPYAGPDALRATITQALENVLDPEVAMNIVDIGLVYGVAIENGIVHVTVTMTSAACPVADVIVNDIEQELDAALPDDLFIQVHLVWEPPWTPERMSAGGRRFMGW
jgi:metal-sulfur cluster biosynthetic enzyme